MKKLFCANEQSVTEHQASLSPDGEFVFTCACGRFVKFPADAENIEELIAKHEETNKGQVSIEAQEAKLAALLKSVEDKPAKE